MGCGGSRANLLGSSALITSSGSFSQVDLVKPALSTLIHSTLCPVSLDFLLEFAEGLNGEITTAQVVESIIKPETLKSKCRYIDLPKMKQHKMPVGGTFYFVSHSWSNSFRDMIDAVHNHLINAVASEVYLYVDIFIITQHEGMDQEDDLKHLRSAVKHAVQTLVCMDRGGIVMSRVWCLYEMWTTVTLKKSQIALVLLSHGLSAQERTAIFSSINVKRARASVSADKARILADIGRSPGGVEGLNATLKLLFLLDPIDALDDLQQLLQLGHNRQRWDWTAADEWLALPPEAENYRAFVIYGDPGSGKSTIAAAMSAHLGVKVMHFCKANDATRNDPVNAIRSLAWQLAAVLPALQMYYAALPANVIAAIGSNAEAAFDALLFRPLSQLFGAEAAAAAAAAGDDGDDIPRELLILMDAVDEAEPTTSTSDDANNMLHLLVNNFAALPSRVRFIVTTRPLGHIQRALTASISPKEVRPEQLRPQAETLHMLADRLQRCGFDRKNVGEAAAALLERSSGSMVYPIIAFELLHSRNLECKASAAAAAAAAAANGVGHHGISCASCCVDDILALPLNLAELFHNYFQWLTSQTKVAMRETVIQLLQVLAAAQQPLSFRHLHALGFERISEDLLPQLGCLFFSRNFHVYGLHKTVYEWLASPASPAVTKLGHHKLGHTAFISMRAASQSVPAKELAADDDPQEQRLSQGRTVSATLQQLQQQSQFEPSGSARRSPGQPRQPLLTSEGSRRAGGPGGLTCTVNDNGVATWSESLPTSPASPLSPPGGGGAGGTKRSLSRSLTTEYSYWSMRRTSPPSAVMGAFSNIRDYELRYAILHACLSFHPDSSDANPLKQPQELTGSLMRGMSHHFDHSSLWAPRRLSAHEKSLTWLEELLLNFDFWEVLFTRRNFAAAVVADLVQWVPPHEVSPVAHDVMHWVLKNHTDLMQNPDCTLSRALEAEQTSAVYRAAAIFYR